MMPQRSQTPYESPDPTLSRTPPPSDELEEQLETARTPFETLAMLEQLAAVWRRTDPRRARRYARQALLVARSSGDPDAICWALIGATRVAAMLQRFDEAWRHLDEARSLAAQCSRLTCAAQVYHIRGVLASHLGSTREAHVEFEIAQELAAQGERRDVLGWILTSVGFSFRSFGRPADAAECAYGAQMIARDVGDRALMVYAADGLGEIAAALNDDAAAIRYLEESLELAEKSGEPSLAFVCRVSLAEKLDSIGRRDEARAMIERAALDEPSGTAHDRAVFHTINASLLERRGEFADALRAAERALAIYEKAGLRPGVSAITIRARVHFGLGQVELSISGHLEAIEEARGRGETLHECSALESLAHILELAERPVEALRYHKEWKAAESVISGGEQQRLTAQIQLRAEVEEAERNRARTLEEAEELERRLEARERELATASLQVVEKSKLLESIVKEMTELTAMIDPSARKSVRALVHRIQSNRESGSYWNRFEQQFEKAHAGFTDELARRCPQLTPMELRLCALLKLGMSTKDIADLLATSPDNVEVYRYRVRKKLGMERSLTFPQFFAKTIASA